MSALAQNIGSVVHTTHRLMGWMNIPIKLDNKVDRLTRWLGPVHWCCPIWVSYQYSGSIPFFLLFNRHPRKAIDHKLACSRDEDIWKSCWTSESNMYNQKASKNIKTAQERQKKYFDASNHVRDTSIHMYMCTSPVILNMWCSLIHTTSITCNLYFFSTSKLDQKYS